MMVTGKKLINMDIAAGTLIKEAGGILEGIEQDTDPLLRAI